MVKKALLEDNNTGKVVSLGCRQLLSYDIAKWDKQGFKGSPPEFKHNSELLNHNATSIEITKYGVRGDKMARPLFTKHFLPYHKKTKWAQTVIDKTPSGFISKDTCQVSLFETNSYTQLQSIFGWTSQGNDIKHGATGENVTTAGIQLWKLKQNSLLTIGTTVLKVKGQRSLCRGMVNTMKEPNNPNTLFKELMQNLVWQRHLCGIMCEVITPGWISLDDNIISVDNPLEDEDYPNTMPISRRWERLKQLNSVDLIKFLSE
jgi:MOSC domain-containing protein YiiM